MAPWPLKVDGTCVFTTADRPIGGPRFDMDDGAEGGGKSRKLPLSVKVAATAVLLLTLAIMVFAGLAAL